MDTTKPTQADDKSGTAVQITRILGIMLAVFSIMFSAGYFYGSQARFSEEYLKGVILSNMRIESVEGVRQLAFPLTNTYWIYRECDSHGFIEQKAYAKVGHDGLRSFPFAADYTGKGWVRVAGTAITTSANAVKERPSVNTVAQFITSGVTAAIGWSIGYQLGIDRAIDMEDPALKKLLQDPKSSAWLNTIFQKPITRNQSL